MKEVILLLVGIWIGVMCGLGWGFSRCEKLAQRKAEINGNVTIDAMDGSPIELSNVIFKQTGDLRLYYPKGYVVELKGRLEDRGEDK